MARRIYKGCTIEHRLNLPVSNIDDLEYLSILLHTKEDNDIIKTYPNDIAFKNDEFVFTISSDDIVFLQEGILWATIDMRVSGVDTNKKIQLPYYIKYREGAASSTLVTVEEVETIVDEKIGENVDGRIDTKIDEKFGVLLDDVESNTNNIDSLKNRVSTLEAKPDNDTIYDDTDLKNRVSALEQIDHNQYLTEHQSLKTINGESIVGEGNIVIEGGEGGTGSYDDTELRNRIEVLEQKEDNDTIYDDTDLKNRVSALEGIDHSQYLTEHQHLKTINGESIVGEGNIVIEGGEGGTGSYDDTELRNRIEALEQKEDNDTIYDDTDLKNRVSALERKEDKDTIYDDTELKNRVQALENKPDRDTIYDDTELKNRVSALEQKEDKDTIYDDTAVRNLITDLSNRLTTVEGRGYLTASDLKTINNTSLVGEGNISIEADYETIYNALDQI